MTCCGDCLCSHQVVDLWKELLQLIEDTEEAKEAK